MERVAYAPILSQIRLRPTSPFVEFSDIVFRVFRDILYTFQECISVSVKRSKVVERFIARSKQGGGEEDPQALLDRLNKHRLAPRSRFLSVNERLSPISTALLKSTFYRFAKKGDGHRHSIHLCCRNSWLEWTSVDLAWASNRALGSQVSGDCIFVHPTRLRLSQGFGASHRIVPWALLSRSGR